MIVSSSISCILTVQAYSRLMRFIHVLLAVAVTLTALLILPSLFGF